MTNPKVAKCLTDPNWRFYKDTDLKRTFNRIRREMKQAEAAKQADSHVLVMKRSAR